ncbi:MAG: cysteine--tRNA ligase [Anaerosomatales bacterium]|nr:cysteine--tRNA ligase [Anaerosomatales bacterium]MDT8434056.1 cysteine--tRNA ligase [Anaerosomatales bacterium]
MSIRVYNTLTRRKEEFVPRAEGAVSIYVCGPTVYNHIHIGNARTFLSFDVIRRYLEWRGFDVTFVQNITDVDDKIIARAAEEGSSAEEVARTYSEAFLDAMRQLGVRRPDVQPRATQTIPEMIEMVGRLIERGHAYEVDGDVYFSVRSFPEYGKLSGRDVDEMRSGARIEVDERKRDPLDFALWKAAKPGEPHWTSPWGEGRPGWHLECSVMSEKELGPAFDIHGGASDLIFPHHENEIAQSEAATGQPFAKYWLHGGLLQVNAEKMSKSLGNFMLLREVLKDYEPPVIRMLMLQTHYRSPLDFSLDRLDEAKAAYERVATLVRNIRWARGTTPVPAGAAPAERDTLVEVTFAARDRFIAEMDDDFNSAGALGALFELARSANSFMSAHPGGLSSADLIALGVVEETLVELLGALGVILGDATTSVYPEEVVGLAEQLAGYAGKDPDAAVEALLAARSVARTERNWAAADAVREGLAELGFVVEDTPQGARVIYSPRAE